MASCGMQSSCGRKQVVQKSCGQNTCDLKKQQYASILPDFSDYKQYKPTQNCYLDGRYFNKVFCKYPGLISEPLCIYLGSGGFDATMPHTKINTNYDGLLRIIIETDEAKHATVAILDHAKKNAYWFEPFSSSFDILIQSIIEKYIGYQVIRVPQQAPNVTNPNCDASGFCTAYIIKYAYDYLNDQPVDFSMIKSFASRVEQEYVLVGGEPDITFGWLDNPRTRNALIGGLGGLAVGSLLGGGFGGALLGAGIGGLGGYALSGPGGLF